MVYTKRKLSTPFVSCNEKYEYTIMSAKIIANCGLETCLESKVAGV